MSLDLYIGLTNDHLEMLENTENLEEYFCKHCGAKFKEDLKTCSKCGQYLTFIGETRESEQIRKKWFSLKAIKDPEIPRFIRILIAINFIILFGGVLAPFFLSLIVPIDINTIIFVTCILVVAAVVVSILIKLILDGLGYEI